MKKVMVLFVLVAGLALSLTTGTLAHTGKDARHFQVDLAPLNDSGVSGQAELKVDGDMLTVKIQATGLEAGQVHPQHIHGFDNPKNSTCPGPERDVNGDGRVDVGEGLPDYGPVILSLVPFNLVDGNGNLDFEETYPIPAGLEPIDTLQNRAIVLHGLTVDGSYEPSLPVACGQIERSPNGPQ